MKYDQFGHFEARLRHIPLEKVGGDGAYLYIKHKNGRFTHGGDQNWWLDDEMDEFSHAKDKIRFQICRKNDRFRLSNLGCGVIAMIDLEIYLSRAHGKEKGQVDKGDPITKETYEEYAKQRWEKQYNIGKSYVSFKAGLNPWKMERGLREFLKEQGLDRRHVRWAPFVLHGKEKQKELVMASIKDMLDADYPVVFAYHTFDEENSSINLFRNLEDAVFAIEGRKGNERIASHYMTIIGVFAGNNGQVVLQVESWGRIYYVLYEEFASKLSYFTNILCIRP
ncbi:MAG: hypothetical protein K6F31_06555 [Acetatifactor sp.]|nr:hypothetical protein [Acetatifactor sp.]